MQAAESIATTVIKFLKEQGAYDQLPKVAELLQKEAFRSHTVTVISALPLDDKEKKSVEKIVEEKWGEHPVSFMTDPLLVSGFLIRFQDQVVDMSGRSSLSQLSEKLKESA